MKISVIKLGVICDLVLEISVISNCRFYLRTDTGLSLVNKRIKVRNTIFVCDAECLFVTCIENLGVWVENLDTLKTFFKEHMLKTILEI